VISRQTKLQLMVFGLISVLGLSFTGVRYAGLGRFFQDQGYVVSADFSDSGGIFKGAEVTNRGVPQGKVVSLKLQRDGVRVGLRMKPGTKIPKDVKAFVGNRSAVGEQYVDLQPQTDKGPYLHDGSQIAVTDTRTPLPTQKLLGDISHTVESVDRGSLRTTVHEFGLAFAGTGPDLQRIIDTGTSFIHAANRNFDVTTALIKDGNTVLRTQSDKGSAIRSFAQNLALFSGVIADNDNALRALIDNGSATANELRTFLEENQVDLGGLINNLVTTGEVVVKHLPGIRQILVLFPYEVASGFTVTAKNAEGYDARFGFVLNPSPAVCHKGYDPKEWRSPTDGSNKPMDTDAHCAEPPSKTNARGAQNAPRAGADYRPAPVASYDVQTGQLTWADPSDPVVQDAIAGADYGRNSWDSLLLAPLG
jgi:phospholipid/cholesterol/gamma-HCH transport system substrate-binding protein